MSSPNIEVLLQFFAADKPTWLKPTRRVVVEELLRASCLEGMEAYLSEQTLADRCNTGVKAIRRAITFLHAQMWLHKKSGKSSFEPNTYAVRIHNLPLTRKFINKIVSVEAGNIVYRYFEILKVLPKYPSKKTPGRMCSAYRKSPTHQQRWEFIAQQWLNAGYSMEQINTIVDAAFYTYPDTARHGMHTLKGKFKTLCKLTGTEPHTTTPAIEKELEAIAI